ncbi:MAG: hypothetical protein ABJQ14_01300, partial [Hyphomicrobiales bacterium]
MKNLTKNVNYHQCYPIKSSSLSELNRIRTTTPPPRTQIVVQISTYVQEELLAHSLSLQGAGLIGRGGSFGRPAFFGKTLCTKTRG